MKINGKIYKIIYSPSLRYKDCSLLGLVNTKNKTIKIKKSLKSSVKKYVLAHEIYHIKDKSRWGGTLGAEIRATIYCGIRNPWGMIETFFTGNIFKKLKDWVKLYILK